MAYSLWERANGMQYDQQTADWTAKWVEYQLEATDKLDAGKLRDKLIKALSGSRPRIYAANRFP